jgi:hypothetical protein
VLGHGVQDFLITGPLVHVVVLVEGAKSGMSVLLKVCHFTVPNFALLGLMRLNDSESCR